MRSDVKVAVIIPCYNTGQACVEVITRARAAANAVLVVDDGSTDDTPEHIRQAGSPCLRLPANEGKGAALKAGIEEVLKGRHGLLGGTFDYILTVDGDGQHDPSDIPRFVSLAIRERADFVIGVRNVRVMPPKSKSATISRASSSSWAPAATCPTRNPASGFSRSRWPKRC